VPACRECNSALGARGFTVRERRELAKAAIEKRYASELKESDWTPEELAEMGPALRADIEQRTRLRDWVRLRLTY
jgi:hypothetical protein